MLGAGHLKEEGDHVVCRISAKFRTGYQQLPPQTGYLYDIS
jgi:hypothetical protein